MGMTPDEQQFLATRAGAIIHEQEQGAVRVTYEGEGNAFMDDAVTTWFLRGVGSRYAMAFLTPNFWIVPQKSHVATEPSRSRAPGAARACIRLCGGATAWCRGSNDVRGDGSNDGNDAGACAAGAVRRREERSHRAGALSS